MNAVNLITLIKAFRIDSTTVHVMYFHNELHQKFLIEWNSIDPAIGQPGLYDLMIDCLSNNESLNEKVCDAIKRGETDENENLKLYLEIIEKFTAGDCEDL